MRADLLVIGGGSAGLAAAVAAARGGLRVLLVERGGMLGGMGTAALVHTFCGLYRLDGETPEFANPGIPVEIAERMQRASGRGPVRMGRCWVLPQHPTDFARLADELVREAGVEVWFHAELVALEPGWSARVACRGRILEVAATAVVDASGDAVAAALLGEDDRRAPAAKLQRPAYVCGVQGVAGEWSGLRLAGRIVEGVRSGALDPAALGMQFRASGRSGEVFGTLDLAGEECGDYDPLDPRCLSAVEASGRAVASRVVDFLARHEPAFAGAYVSHWPARAGIRESRRWRGRATLTGAAVLAGERRDDEVALAAWPLELRETNRGAKLRYPVDGRPAGIPAGALTAANFDRLFVAGRCLSCDHEAQASIRVMGTCFATGEAAARLAVASIESPAP